MKKITQTFLLLFFIGINGQIQQGSNSNPVNFKIDLHPKTPEATALSKFVDIPAGNYTGVSDFSIPLYTIDFDGEKIPIELTYTTTGIKVGQIATRVGLGWVLNTGPSLSQQVIGMQDRIFPRPIIQTNFSPNASNDLPNSDYDIAMRATGLRGTPIDVKPDIFTYSLLNNNGKFILEANGNVGIPMPYNQIKILKDPFYQVNIVDEKGFAYTFNSQFLGVQNKNDCVDPNAEFNYPDPDFKISIIKSTKNKEIKYLYNAPAITSQFISSLITRERVNLSGDFPPGDLSWKGFLNECVNRTTLFDQPLSEIQFAGGKVLLTYNDKNLTPRLDLNGERYITNIIVKNDNDIIIKDYTLNYEYFSSQDPDPTATGIFTYMADYIVGLNKRLKLISVKDNLTNGIYVLKYYESYNNKVLPIRISNSQDFWGVYNGEDNGEKAISVSKYETVNIQSDYLGANKNPNIKYGELGNLRKIIYPTGGYSSIEYEADDYDISENPEIIYNYDIDYRNIEANDNIFPAIATPFDIPSNAKDKFLNFSGGQNEGSSSTDGRCYVNLEKPDGTIEPIKVNGYFSRNDPPGSYKLSVERDYRFPNVRCNATYYFNTEVATPIDTLYTKPTGTIRVSKIESIDNNGGKIIRKYSYKEPTLTHALPYTKSSGINQGEQLFMSTSLQKYPIDNKGHFAVEKIASNNPGWQTSTVKGKAVGYSHVQEYYIDEITPSNSYRKEHKFKNDIETKYHDPGTAVNVSWIMSNFDNGVTLEESLFNSSNNIVKKLSTEYQYDWNFNTQYSSNPLDITSVGVGLEIVPTKNFFGIYTFDATTFPLKNYWLAQKQTITTDYTSVGDSLQTIRTINYSIPEYLHTFPKENLKTGSLGETLKTTYQYPQDITIANPQYGSMQKLISKNQIADPVITKSYTDNLVTSEIRILYDQFNTGNDEMTLPKFIYLKKGENAIEEDRKITYNSYDIKGNLTQYTLESGIPVTVIWGYNKTLPILKIEGALYDDIKDKSAITTAIAAATNDNMFIQGVTPEQTETALIAALDAVRMHDNFKSYHVTSYSYDPLVGVRSVTPPSGMREVFIYDDAKRLQEIKRMELDANGSPVYKILKANEYHYQQ